MSAEKSVQEGEELLLGICAAIGTDTKLITQNLAASLKVINYELVEVKLSERLAELPENKTLPTARDENYYKLYMNAGND